MAGEQASPDDGMPEGETTAEAIARITKAADGAPMVCILGGTSMNCEDSEALIKGLVKELSAAVGDKAVFITGGMPGVQKAFAESCPEDMRLWNLLPVGKESGYGCGLDIHAGVDLDQRKEVFGLLGDIYITIEGGPGVAGEAKAAHARGAGIVPFIRTGGASSGMFEFPAEALKRPAEASEEQWAALESKDAPVAEASQAAAAVVAAMVVERATKQVSIWDLLDELIGLDRSTLLKIMGVALTILIVISVSFIWREVSRGRLDLAALHGGFLFLVFGLIGSIAYVLSIASSLEGDKGSDKKTD